MSNKVLKGTFKSLLKDTRGDALDLTVDMSPLRNPFIRSQPIGNLYVRNRSSISLKVSHFDSFSLKGISRLSSTGRINLVNKFGFFYPPGIPGQVEVF